MCANVCKLCAKIFMCKNYFCNLFHFAISPFSFYKLLMLLWNSFANSWDLYFLKGIVELERYEAWNLALQINDVTPIKCGNAEICWAKNPVVSFIFRLQLISIWQFEPWRLNTMPKTLPHWESKIILRGGGQNFLSGLEEIYFTILPPLAHISIENWDYLVAMFEKW
jgi:hypothetical protein